MNYNLMMAVLAKHGAIGRYFEETHAAHTNYWLRTIDAAFTWSGTREGGMYWSSIYGEVCSVLHRIQQ